MPRGSGGYQYLIVAIDKFTKWIEVEPIRAQTAQAAISFVRGIVCHFGVPNCIITDHGSLFTSGPFRAYCEQLGTRICYSSVSHPHSNGQAEWANGEVRGLKTRTFDRLKRAGVGWIDHVFPVLSSLHTTPSWATGETPFNLVYEAEAVLPTELKYRSPRTRSYDEETRYESRIDDVNFLEEARCRAAMRNA